MLTFEAFRQDGERRETIDEELHRREPLFVVPCVVRHMLDKLGFAYLAVCAPRALVAAGFLCVTRIDVMCRVVSHIQPTHRTALLQQQASQ